MKQIVAKEGYYYTQKEVKSDGERVYTLRLMLAENDDESNWVQVPVAEFYEWQKRMDKEVEEHFSGK